MYSSGWIDTSDPSTLSSGWVDSFVWHSAAVDGEPDPDDEGTCVVHLRTDGELRKYMYNDVPYKLFDRIRRVALYGGEDDSVGATFTAAIKENKDIGPATRKDEVAPETTAPSR